MTTVFVGLSGGVDSAVSAALLSAGGGSAFGGKEQKYEVTGVFIKIWQPEFIECTWREDRLDAMRVAAALQIPFREIDFSDEYRREVVDAMTTDYARGITPNPDVLCNHVIKFGHFFRWARAEGADYVATGHYARISRLESNFGFRKPEYMGLRNPYLLLRGADKNKDQSYFLYQLTQQDLSRTLFPIGSLTKREVRALARKFGLPNAEKHDSQGLCFVGDVSMEEFLARFIPLSRGAVTDVHGNTVGEHRGAALYTIGQRHGFTMHGPNAEGAHYIVSTDISANTITVSANRLEVARMEFTLEHVNWIGELPSFPCEADAQARYRETPARVRIEKNGEEVRGAFFEPHIVAPGQSLVLYKGERCLGGGTILR